MRDLRAAAEVAKQQHQTVMATGMATETRTLMTITAMTQEAKPLLQLSHTLLLQH